MSDLAVIFGSSKMLICDVLAQFSHNQVAHKVIKMEIYQHLLKSNDLPL